MPQTEVGNTVEGDPAGAPYEAGLTPERRAAAVVDAILHGISLEEVAAKCAGGSIVRILQMLGEGSSRADLRNLIQMHELHCGWDASSRHHRSSG